MTPPATTGKQSLNQHPRCAAEAPAPAQGQAVGGGCSYVVALKLLVVQIVVELPAVCPEAVVAGGGSDLLQEFAEEIMDRVL